MISLFSPLVGLSNISLVLVFFCFFSVYYLFRFLKCSFQICFYFVIQPTPFRFSYCLFTIFSYFYIFFSIFSSLPLSRFSIRYLYSFYYTILSHFGVFLLIGFFSLPNLIMLSFCSILNWKL